MGDHNMTIDKLFEDTNAEYINAKNDGSAFLEWMNDDNALLENEQEKYERFQNKYNPLHTVYKNSRVISGWKILGSTVGLVALALCDSTYITNNYSRFIYNTKKTKKKFQVYCDLVNRDPTLRSEYAEIKDIINDGPSKENKKLVKEKTKQFSKDLKRIAKESGITNKALKNL